MGPETLVCAEHVPVERLSALRDGGLSPADEQKLRAHIAMCPACTARMADFDAIAVALRGQRELEPGDRILNNVHVALTSPQPSRWRLHTSRRLWTRLATLAPVAAVILLFVFVFSSLAGRIGPHPASGSTPTATEGKSIVPTSTHGVGTPPTYTQSVSAEQAWGTRTTTSTFTTDIGGGHVFLPQGLASDGRTLAGIDVSNLSADGIQGQFTLGVLDTQTHQFTGINQNWQTSNAAGYAEAVDNQFMVYGFNNSPGATCGVCHNTLWSYDRLSGVTWQITPGKNYSGDQDEMISGDYVAFVSTQRQVWVADLAARTVTYALPSNAQPATSPSYSGPSIQLMGFDWPYITYGYTPQVQADGSAVATTLRVTNLQTHTTQVLLPEIDKLFGARNISANATYDPVYFSNDTLYVIAHTQLGGDHTGGSSYGTLYEIDHVFHNNSQPKTLAVWNSSANVARGGTFGRLNNNGRLIALGAGYVWDIQEQKLVLLDPQSTIGVSGSYMIMLQMVSDASPQAPIQRGVIYDTSTFPVR